MAEYSKVRNRIRDADILLFRPTTAIGRVIARKGGYSHAAMAIWWNGRLMCVGTQQWRGNFPEHLADLVKKFPGVIDVYRAKKRDGRALNDNDRKCVVGAMIDMDSQLYGWLSLLKAALVNARLTKWFWRKMFESKDDKANGHRPHCSQAVTMAYQDGMGLDLNPGLAPYATTPGDLVQSTKLLFTLE